MIKSNNRVVFAPQIIAIIMLLGALYPSNPYGYYVILRIVLCIICAYLAFRANELATNAWVWILGVIALIYNPIVKVHLNREIWTAVNIATIIVLAISLTIFCKKGSDKNNEIKEYED